MPRNPVTAYKNDFMVQLKPFSFNVNKNHIQLRYGAYTSKPLTIFEKHSHK